MDDVFAGILTLEIWMPENSSLKDKRKILRGLIERLRNRFNVSVSEVGGHDLWQRATLGVACVSGDRKEAERAIDLVLDWVLSQDDFEVTYSSVEIR